MLLTILLSIAVLISALWLGGWLSDKFKASFKRQQELHERLQQLEDRFYNPGNYNNAFFRPIAKKKEETK